MRGHLSFRSEEPDQDAKRYVVLLERRLQALGLRNLGTDRYSIRARVGVVRFALKLFHPFKGITSFQFRARPSRDQVRVEYEISVVELACLFGVAGIALVALLVTRTSLPALAIAAFIAVLGTGFAVNWLVVGINVRRVLSETGAQFGRNSART